MLILKRDDYNTMLEHCVSGLPNEACGLIAGIIDGEIKTVKKVYLLTNTDESREHFSMDPKEQLAAVKDARKNGLELLGNFHSHPESPSRPSEEDKRLAYDSSSEYLILSLMDMADPVLHAFHIDKEKNVSKNEIKILDERGAKSG
ncbi:M67 family metallopeptidase [Lachnospiraceae bacterium 54-53]